MRIPIHWRFITCPALVLLLVSGVSGLKAQSAADQSFKTIPQQVKESAENKTVTKANNTSNNAMNKLDSASDKVFKGFTNLFKKKNNSKNKKSGADSTVTKPADTLAAPPKTSWRTMSKPAFYCDLPDQRQAIPIDFFNPRINFKNV
jgi:hypothetical protein